MTEDVKKPEEPGFDDIEDLERWDIITFKDKKGITKTRRVADNDPDKREVVAFDDPNITTENVRDFRSVGRANGTFYPYESIISFQVVPEDHQPNHWMEVMDKMEEAIEKERQANQ